MDKINTQELHQTLNDVRKSYRLLALYQRRILDTVKFIANHYNLQLQGGHSKFSNTAKKGKGVQFDHWSWDWLSMYLYEFNLGSKIIDSNTYHFKIIHQADTGFYDTNHSEKISKTNLSQFASSEQSESYLYFIISKNSDGWPLEKLLKDHLHKDSDNSFKKENDWFYAKYTIERFINQDSCDNVFKEYNNVVKDNFDIDLTELNSISKKDTQ